MHAIKTGKAGQFNDVMMTYLQQFVEMVADTSSLHHQIDQAFPIFFSCVLKNMDTLYPLHIQHIIYSYLLSRPSNDQVSLQ